MYNNYYNNNGRPLLFNRIKHLKNKKKKKYTINNTCYRRPWEGAG